MADSNYEYKIKFENELYTICVKDTDNGEQNSIMIEVKNNESYYYRGIFSLNELMMLSKAFKSCDNINDVLNIFSKIFGTFNKSFLKRGNNENEIYLFLKIYLPSGEEQEIRLILNKIENNENASNEELIEKIKKLEEENKKLKEEIVKLKKENTKKDKIIESLRKNNINVDIDNNDDDEFEEKNESQLQNDNLNTDIIYNEEELDFLEKRLKEINYFQNKNIKYQLLYKGTKNGDKAYYFHTRVDGIRNTLTLVKTKKGKRFGGFTSENWNQIGGYGKVDPRAFCFSFDLKKIYNSQPNQLATFCSNEYGPYFKGTNTIFGIYNNFFSQGGWCDYTTFSYSFGKFKSNFEITNGEQKFNIEEVEVFKVYTD